MCLRTLNVKRNDFGDEAGREIIRACAAHRRVSLVNVALCGVSEEFANELFDCGVAGRYLYVVNA
eukprot:3243054-Rhodomonas_salina.1